MFHNYLITALRNFTRHKLYGFINIAGLTVGLTCAIFIILFVRDQLSYDRWIPDTENLYQVDSTLFLRGQVPLPDSKIPFTVTQAMLEQIPEVRARTRLLRNPVTVLLGNRQFPETMDSVDPNFFQVIKLPLIAGDAGSVFTSPNSVVLSETRAHKYFGGETALGKTIVISASYCDEQGDCQSRQHPLTVTGILRDLPHNTQLAADLVMPNTSRSDPTGEDAKTNWLHTEGWGYVLLAPGADRNRVTAKLRIIIDHNLDARKRGFGNLRGSEVMAPRLTSFRDVHLSTDKYSGMTPPGSWTTIYGFAAIGVLILLVACFNFTNLATARAMIRGREISLRKVVGATQRQLIVQYLGESVLTAMISMVLAMALTEMLLPFFDRFLNMLLQFNYLRHWPVLLSIIGIGIVVGLLSGIYPALVLSGIRPAAVLRSNAGQSGSGILRTALVVLQFAVSIGLGIAVLVVFAQVSFARHVDLGFHKDGLLLIDAESLSASAQESFARALRANPAITDVAISDTTAVPFASSENNSDVSAPGNPSHLTFRVISADPHYTGVYGIRLLAGRSLSEQHGADTVTDMHVSRSDFSSAPYNILLNETAARMLGYSTKSAIGKTVMVHRTPATVVGVVADIKMDGASLPVAPTVYRHLPLFTSQLTLRLRDEKLSRTLGFIDRTWHTFSPSVAISRHFLNDDFENQFLREDRQGDIFGLFVGIAIFIASLGLYGLAAFSTERRTKDLLRNN